jgi:hypothetical protein
MSTTLVPPTWYVIKPRGQTVHVFSAIAEVATALVKLGPTPATVGAIIGTRTRSLTETELRELRDRVRATTSTPTRHTARKHAQTISPYDAAGADRLGRSAIGRGI